MSANTLFLRLEGPMQAWGNQESKFVIRRTVEAPTKSGVIGLLCAALGIARADAPSEWLPRLSALRFGVRIDRPGVRWWDYHTVGAGMQMRIAEAAGKNKTGPILSRREYICDASFLVAVQGDTDIIAQLQSALAKPRWTLYLGRKCCPPSRPILEHDPGLFADLQSAMHSIPWRPRLKGDTFPQKLTCLLDWAPTTDEPQAPGDAVVWYDVPLTLAPPSHRPRFVLRLDLTVGENGAISVATSPVQKLARPPLRTRANYTNSAYRKVRQLRLDQDYHLCVFCKSPATTVQHVTYRHAGGKEQLNELKSLCRLCHDAVTMLEYGQGMGLDRIDPEEAQWRDRIIQKRAEIIEFRSLETRRRRLSAEEVE